ncbi:integral membrane protein [Aspergillus sclerotialis]|uniref:Integral membrane protein n=1 Tax=Aspergillus sclerotialis TaxID=2070753 RepID=A0A3A2ZDW1_9EURO|nr:integral membrane protein [Aspergillus sclerotialis]
MDPDTSVPADKPPIFNYVLSFLLVGVAWGFTTPFLRRAAADFNARQEAKQNPQGTPLTQTGGSRRGEGEEQELLEGDQDSASDSDSNHARDESEDPNRDDNGTTDNPPPVQTTQAQPQPQPAWLRQTPQSRTAWLKTKLSTLIWTIINLLRTPAYSIPLVINLTGSVWFFLLVGKHELSLTVPLANSSAFLFTVLGEWYVERKVIANETWIGMVLVLAGIGICVQSKDS